MSDARLRVKLPATLAVCLFALPALSPLFLQGLAFTFDGQTHLQRLGALQRSVASGVLLPRWLTEMQLGYGYPLFTFYSPGAYYVALLPALAGSTLDRAYAWALAAAVMIAGIGAWKLASDVFGSRAGWGAALLAGTTYSYSAYLLVNVYVRGSLPEALGQALLPWVLWSGRRAVAHPQPQRDALIMALLVGGLMLTHSLLLTLTVPYLLIYLAIVWQRAGRRRRTLYWLGGSLAAAAGVSAFFWLPMLVGRQYLTDAGYQSARLGWLPDNGWTWANFLDWHLVYEYVAAYPVQLSLVGAILAAGGLALAKRRDGEWLFFGGSALVCCILIGGWTLPLWQSNDLLAAFQFPWRLLGLASLSFAILTGGWLSALDALPQWFRVSATAVLIMVVVLTQRPQLDSTRFYAPGTYRVDAPRLAAYEVQKGVLTNNASSSVEEFRPYWTLDGSAPACAGCSTDSSLPPPDLQTSQAGSPSLTMQVSTPLTTSLRFQEYFFPSWRAIGQNNTALEPYASGPLGLLTVDLPADTYGVKIQWDGPPLASVGSIVSLAILACLLAAAIATGHHRFALVLALFLTMGLASWLVTPPPTALQKPAAPLDSSGVRLLAFSVEPAGPSRWLLRPYWYVYAQPPEDLQVRLQLRAPDGQIVQEYVQRPYFNQSNTESWQPGTIVDDAQQIALPDGFEAGIYDLALALESAADNSTGRTTARPVVVGQVEARQTGSDVETGSQTVTADYGGVHLVGASYAVDGQQVNDNHDPFLLIKPGQSLLVRLFWLPSTTTTAALHGFVHLVDAQGGVVAQRDQTPGPDDEHSTLWLPGITVVDEYHLRIPQDMTSTVVWPHVGLYDAATVELRSVLDANGGPVGDFTRLAPIKIKSDRPVNMSQTTAIQFAEMAELTGFDVTPGRTVRAAESLTITLAFRSEQTTETDLTRFVHLHSPQLGMAAQADGIPQSGNNPTWSWTPGEIIQDQVVLHIAPEVAPGRYRLLTGFYDKAQNNNRLAVTDNAGSRLPDDIAVLAEIEVLAGAVP